MSWLLDRGVPNSTGNIVAGTFPPGRQCRQSLSCIVSVGRGHDSRVLADCLCVLDWHLCTPVISLRVVLHYNDNNLVKRVVF